MAADEFVRVVRIDVVGRQEGDAMLEVFALVPHLLRGNGEFTDLAIVNRVGPQPVLTLKRVVGKVRDSHDAASGHKCLTNKMKKGRFSIHELKSSRAVGCVKGSVNQTD